MGAGTSLVTPGGGSRDRGEPRKPAEEIEDEIRCTRTELGLTLDALAHQLAPRQLLGKSIGMITESIKGSRAVRIGFGEAVRANRLPLALIGTGVAWMIARNLPTAGGSAEGHAASSKWASDPKSDAPGGSLRAAVERNPLLIGLVGLVSGAVLAALLPATKREREWVGETREELWKKAEEVGHEAADGVRNLAEHKACAADD